MGRVILELSRGKRKLSRSEERFRRWVEDGPDDLMAVFSTLYEDGPPYRAHDRAALGVEEFLPDGRIAAQWVDVNTANPPEVWSHIEALARAGLEKVKAEACWPDARMFDPDRL